MGLLVCRFIENQSNYLGAVGSVVSGVVGVAGAISGNNEKNRQAEAQRRALIDQERAASRNLDLRLQEIEQQRMYAQYQAQIESVARANNAAYQQQEDLIRRQEIDFSRAQQQYMAQIQNQRTQAQLQDQRNISQVNLNTQTGVTALNQQAGQENLGLNRVQRDLALQSQGLQTQLGRNQLLGRQGLQQAGEDINYQTALQQEQLTFDQNLRNLVNQYGQQQIGINAQQLGAEQEALQGSRELNRLAQQGDQEIDQAQQIRGATLQQAAQGDVQGISESARIRSQAGLNEAQQNAINRRMVINEGQSMIGTNLELQRGLANFSRQESQRGLIDGARGLASTRQISANQRENQRLLSQFGRQQERQDFESTAGVNAFLSSMGNTLADRQQVYALDQQSRMANYQLGQQQQLMGIQNDQFARQQQMSQAEMEYMILQASLDAGMENQAMDILQQARSNTNLLEEQASQLNQTMSDMAFSQNAFSTINTGRAEINALAAQRNNVRGAGFMSYASGIAQGGLQIGQGIGGLF